MILKTRHFNLVPPTTPVADALQKPPQATDAQWEVYINEVRNIELSGITNPTFMVDAPWVKRHMSRDSFFK